MASLALPSSPTYDPWAWLVWGREVGKLSLETGIAPSWKPLPVVVTTVLGPAGNAAPDLWLVVSRAGGVLAVAMCARLAWRLAEGRSRLIGAVLAGGCLLLVHDYVKRTVSGNAEPLMVALGLLAVDRHLDGHRRQALGLAVAAALARPEAWPFVGLYAIYVWRADPRARLVVAGLVALIPLLWFGGPLWGSGNPFQPSQAAMVPLRTAAGATQHHGLMVVDVFLAVFPLPAKVLFLPALAACVWRPGLRRRVALAFTAGGLAWIATVAVLAHQGYPALARYLFMPAALALVVAGVGVATIAEALSAAGPLRPLRTAAVAAGLAIAVALMARPDVTAVHVEAQQAADQARRDFALVAAIERAGGRKAVVACGAPITGWFETTTLAWHLGLDTDDVTAVTPRGPQIIFLTRRGGSGISGRLPRRGHVIDAGPWRVIKHCGRGSGGTPA